MVFISIMISFILILLLYLAGQRGKSCPMVSRLCICLHVVCRHMCQQMSIHINGGSEDPNSIGPINFFPIFVFLFIYLKSSTWGGWWELQKFKCDQTFEFRGSCISILISFSCHFVDRPIAWHTDGILVLQELLCMQ